MVLLAAIILPKTSWSFIWTPLQTSLASSFCREHCLLPGSFWLIWAWATSGLDATDGVSPFLQHRFHRDSGFTPNPPEVQLLFGSEVSRNTGAFSRIFFLGDSLPTPAKRSGVMLRRVRFSFKNNEFSSYKRIFAEFNEIRSWNLLQGAWNTQHLLFPPKIGALGTNDPFKLFLIPYSHVLPHHHVRVSKTRHGSVCNAPFAEQSCSALTTHTLFFKRGSNQRLRRPARRAELKFPTPSRFQYQSPVLTDSLQRETL